MRKSQEVNILARQITVKEIRDILGCKDNNQLGNTLSGMLYSLADYMSRDKAEITRKCCKYRRDEARKIFDRLDELGYYDEVK